jgi:phosphatidylinositol-3-phosphatase
MRTRRIRPAAALLAALIGAVLLAATLPAVTAASAGAAAAATAGRGGKTAALCGSRAGQRPRVGKVLWIFMENRSYGTARAEIPGSPLAPYVDHQLIGHCGSTSDYHAITHPSYPNYLAATSGSTQAAGADGLRFFRAQSIFSQVDPSWRSYEEYMPARCDHVAQTGSPVSNHYYVGRHNPAASYSALPVGAPRAGDCRKYDEALGTTRSGALVHDVRTGKLPRFSFVTPGLCDDMHLATGCPTTAAATAAGSAWLARWIPIIAAGSDYADGHLVIDIAWDEGSGGANGASCRTSDAVNCIVPDIVISPYTRHVVSGTDFSHYSLLKMTEKLLHRRYLGAAARRSTRNLCRPFGLCP